MKFLSTILFVSLMFLSNLFPQQEKNTFAYEINLQYYADDIFHVTCYPPKLTSADTIYNFVAFAPGVHQVLNFGRYVKSFNAYDTKGEEITVENVSTNKWKISDPIEVYKIKYDIEDTFDADVEEDLIYPMSGTGIQDEYIIINTHGVIGYFNEHKSDPVTLDIIYNTEWEIGTALEKNEKGIYEAGSYYQLADSPILLGNLTVSSTKIGNIDVEAYVYSPIDEINSDKVLELADEILNSAYEFTTFAPVDHYTFLMYFYDRKSAHNNPVFRGGGALEHSYSSTYALPAMPQLMHLLANIIAHEFMHILTPLNLRSEIIANFDYSKPTAEDQHLWLYEGVTEWVSNIMQLRSGLMDLDKYLEDISEKINNSERIGNDYSLTRLSAEWFTEEGKTKYGNIYQLGALTAGALDIRLLELSNGKRGLREVYLELIGKYGKDKPFNNASFFDEFADITYPEIKDFIDDYIKNNKPIVYDEIYSKLGIEYIESRPSENKTPIFGLRFTEGEGGLIKINGFTKEHKNFGLQEGDHILEVFGTHATLANSDSLIAIKNEMSPGDKYTIKVKRENEELEFTGELLIRMDYHVFEVNKEASEEQLKLREQWSKNLKLN